MVEKYQAFQTLCQIGIAIFSILAIFCTYGQYHYGTLKDQVKERVTNSSDTSKNDLRESPKFVNHSKPTTLKHETNKHNDDEENSINNSHGLIVTKNQSGGLNTVNYMGEKFNPANVANRPLFDNNGYYGPNILNETIKTVTKDSSYSFCAKIPVNTTLQVVLQRIGDSSQPFWVMQWGQKNWRYNHYDQSKNWVQKFDLDEGLGDLNIYFRNFGELKLTIIYNGEFLSEKILKCE